MLAKSCFLMGIGSKLVMIDVICQYIPHNDVSGHTNPYESTGNYDKLHEVPDKSAQVRQSP
jgi:hypothetical protein